MRLPVGISNFAKVVDEGYCFVDKSMFIDHVLDSSAEVLLITRPRRFGKTFNMSMLSHYLTLNDPDTNKQRFVDLAINQYRDKYAHIHGKYPVIFISFKNIKASNDAEALEKFLVLLSEVYKQSRFIMESEIFYPDEKASYLRVIEKDISKAEAEIALLNLIEYLHRYYNKKVFVLIDEYDTPLHEAYANGFDDSLLRFLRNMLGSALKDNIYLEKAVLTGILRIAHANMFSDLNNVSYYTVLNKTFSEDFGFTHNEVMSLNQRLNIDASMQLLQQWYDGYCIADQELFNPWSIIKFLSSNNQPQNYWVGTGGDVLLRDLLLRSDNSVKIQFEQLLQGYSMRTEIDMHVVFADLRSNIRMLWTLLLFAGYLTTKTVAIEAGKANCELALPNNEVKAVFENIVTDWIGRGDATNYQLFINNLLQGNFTEFQESLQRYLEQSASYFDLNEQTTEQAYHMLALGLVVGLRDKFIISSNRESGAGRYDLILLPKAANQSGIIIEFKVAADAEQLQNSAKQAVEQIIQKDYATQMWQHAVSKVQCIGIAFSAKQVQLETKLLAHP